MYDSIAYCMIFFQLVKKSDNGKKINKKLWWEMISYIILMEHAEMLYKLETHDMKVLLYIILI